MQEPQHLLGGGALSLYSHVFELDLLSGHGQHAYMQLDQQDS